MDLQDPIEAEATLVICKNVPPELMEANRAKEYFRKYGPIKKMRLKINSMKIWIYYEQLDSAEKAVANAGNYYGQKFKVSLGSSKSRLNRSSTSTNDEVMMELQAHSGYAHVQEELRDRKLFRLQKKLQPMTTITMKHERSTTTPPKPMKLRQERSGKLWTPEQLDLLKILKQPAFTTEERYKVLDACDKLIRLRNKKSAVQDILKAKHTVGTCPDMCPEKERLLRVVQHQVSSYEQEPNTKQMVPELAVKQYSRSSADQESPLPHDLRPVSVLQMTMNYLMQEVMNDCDIADVNLGDWYHYMWDRTRAIRKDITQQELCSQGSVNLVEQCARFHIHCSARLAGEDPSVFDQKINTENLTKCLQTLKYMYHDLSLKGEKCLNEPEFRAYIILLNLNDGNFMWEVQQLDQTIQKSPEIRFALEVYSCIDKNNYIRFFKLVQSTTYLNACILLRYFLQVRYRALETIVRCYSPRNMYTMYPLDELCKLLAFESLQAARHFVEAYNLYLNSEKTHLVLDKKAFSIPEIPLGLERAINFIECKRNMSVGEVVCGSMLPEKTYLHHVPHTSFDKNGYFNIKEYFPDVDDINLAAKDEPDGEVVAKIPAFEVKPPVNIFKVEAEVSQSGSQLHLQSDSQDEVKPFWANQNVKMPVAQEQPAPSNIFGLNKPVNKPQGGFKFDLNPTLKSNNSSIFNTTTDREQNKLFFKAPEKSNTFQGTASTFGGFNQQTTADSTTQPPKSMFKFSLSPQKVQSSFFPENSVNNMQMELKQKVDLELRKKLAEKAEMEKKLREKQEELERRKLQQLEEQRRQEEARRLEMEQIEAEKLRMKQLEEQRRQQEILRKQQEEADLKRKQEAERMQRLLDEQRRNEELQRLQLEQKRAEEERQRKILAEKLRLQEINSSVNAVMNDLLTKVVKKCRDDRLADIRNKVKIEKTRLFVYKWYRFVETQKSKRKYIQNSLWLSTIRPEQEAKELYSSSQNSTLSDIKRYKFGMAENLKLLAEKSLTALDIASTVYPTIIDILSRQNKLENYLFWKCIVSIPDSIELETDLNDLNDDLIQLLDIKAANKIIKTVKTVLNNIFTYCIAKQMGIGQSQKDFDGIVIITKNLNRYFIDRLSRLVKKYSKTYSPPVYIIIEEPMNNIDSFKKFLNDSSITNYKIVCSALYSQNLPDLLTNAFKFLAKNIPLVPRMELEYLSNYLAQNMGVELWTKIRTMADYNLPYKNCLTKPKIVVNLYNEAVERLKNIAFGCNFKIAKEFSLDFAEIAQKIKPETTPYDYKHFPAMLNEVEYKRSLDRGFKYMKLPDYEAIWPPKTQKDLEEVVFNYLSNVFEYPIPKFYLIMARVLSYVTNDFDEIDQFDWTNVIEIIATEKIKELDCESNHKEFDELFVIYHKESLKSYNEDFWFYLENEHITEELDFKLEEKACGTDIDECGFVESPQSRKRKLSLDFEDFDLDAMYNSLFNTSESKSEEPAKNKIKINNIKRLMQDLDDSIEISRKINVKLDTSIKSLFTK